MLMSTIHIQVSCTELLGFLPSSTLQGIHTGMQLVISKSFHTANSEQNRLNFVAPAYFHAHSITGYKLGIRYGSRFPIDWFSYHRADIKQQVVSSSVVEKKFESGIKRYKSGNFRDVKVLPGTHIHATSDLYELNL